MLMEQNVTIIPFLYGYMNLIKSLKKSPSHLNFEIIFYFTTAQEDGYSYPKNQNS